MKRLNTRSKSQGEISTKNKKEVLLKKISREIPNLGLLKQKGLINNLPADDNKFYQLQDIIHDDRKVKLQGDIGRSVPLSIQQLFDAQNKVLANNPEFRGINFIESDLNVGGYNPQNKQIDLNVEDMIGDIDSPITTINHESRHAINSLLKEDDKIQKYIDQEYWSHNNPNSKEYSGGYNNPNSKEYWPVDPLSDKNKKGMTNKGRLIDNWTLSDDYNTLTRQRQNFIDPSGRFERHHPANRLKAKNPQEVDSKIYKKRPYKEDQNTEKDFLNKQKVLNRMWHADEYHGYMAENIDKPLVWQRYKGTNLTPAKDESPQRIAPKVRNFVANILESQLGTLRNNKIKMADYPKLFKTYKSRIDEARTPYLSDTVIRARSDSVSPPSIQHMDDLYSDPPASDDHGHPTTNTQSSESYGSLLLDNNSENSQLENEKNLSVSGSYNSRGQFEENKHAATGGSIKSSKPQSHNPENFVGLMNRIESFLNAVGY